MRTCWLLSIPLLFITYTSLTQTLTRYEYEEYQMGTAFRLIFYAASDTVASSAAVAAFDRVMALNQIFSDYNNNSEVSQLSEMAGSGQKIKVSNELWEVINYSKEISKASKGVFDVSIGALSKLWRRAFRQQLFPDEAAIKDAKATVNYRAIKLYPETQEVKLTLEKTRLDFGGIAKGYAVDEAMKVLKNRGISHALVDGGGDILVSNAPPNEEGWQIAIEKGENLTITNQAIASSGNSYQFLEYKGVKYSHIINPKTGLGTTDEKQVSIISDNCMQADALASACSIVNKKRGKKLARKLDSKVIYTQ